MMTQRLRWASWVGCCAVGASAAALACSDDGGSGPTEDGPAFAENYAKSYVEVRDCRPSGDHDLNNIRVLTDPTSVSVYEDRSGPFDEGAIVLKEEYEFDDAECSGSVKQWTVMRKLAKGESAETLDWEWQRVDAERRVVGVNSSRCINCHSMCDSDGYDFTCADP